MGTVLLTKYLHTVRNVHTVAVTTRKTTAKLLATASRHFQLIALDSMLYGGYCTSAQCISALRLGIYNMQRSGCAAFTKSSYNPSSRV